MPNAPEPRKAEKILLISRGKPHFHPHGCAEPFLLKHGSFGRKYDIPDAAGGAGKVLSKRCRRRTLCIVFSSFCEKAHRYFFNRNCQGHIDPVGQTKRAEGNILVDMCIQSILGRGHDRCVSLRRKVEKYGQVLKIITVNLAEIKTLIGECHVYPVAADRFSSFSIEGSEALFGSRIDSGRFVKGEDET